jgi:hypothetical protein
MFNVKPASTVPGFRVNPMLDEPGFRVEPERYGFAGADGARSANGGVTPTYVPGPGGGGGGDPLDKCTLARLRGIWMSPVDLPEAGLRPLTGSLGKWLACRS